ncbi:unnamed protein product [Pleuronectes platessa]|uniref:Uncharacterized protein n=1 Tax=Pleuronectes platessa TaxID=8262 RepID=A0A9N7Y7Q0_PLEPL|nr:unnamed protein product [Pleuronectes platessa]
MHGSSKYTFRRHTCTEPVQTRRGDEQSLSLPPPSIHQQHFHQSVQREDHPTPQPPSRRLPALRAYKYGLTRTGKSWSSEARRVAAEHPPSSYPPFHRFSVF